MKNKREEKVGEQGRDRGASSGFAGGVQHSGLSREVPVFLQLPLPLSRTERVRSSSVGLECTLHICPQCSLPLFGHIL